MVCVHPPGPGRHERGAAAWGAGPGYPGFVALEGLKELKGLKGRVVRPQTRECKVSASLAAIQPSPAATPTPAATPDHRQPALRSEIHGEVPIISNW